MKKKEHKHAKGQSSCDQCAPNTAKTQGSQQHNAPSTKGQPAQNQNAQQGQQTHSHDRNQNQQRPNKK
jgi:hypothetical protein